MLAISLVVATLIYLGMRSAESLGKALAKMARGVNRILRPLLKREYLSEHRAYEFAADAAEGLHLLLKPSKYGFSRLPWRWLSRPC
jgi:glycosyltransferase 2 family protein